MLCSSVLSDPGASGGERTQVPEHHWLLTTVYISSARPALVASWLLVASAAAAAATAAGSGAAGSVCLGGEAGADWPSSWVLFSGTCAGSGASAAPVCLTSESARASTSSTPVRQEEESVRMFLDRTAGAQCSPLDAEIDRSR